MLDHDAPSVNQSERSTNSHINELSTSRSIIRAILPASTLQHRFTVNTKMTDITDSSRFVLHPLMIAIQAYLATRRMSPPIPHRRSSIQASRPQPPKKRLSLNAIPILSKFGLGKTYSSPLVASGSSATTYTPPACTSPLSQPTGTTARTEVMDLGDDAKTEVDKDERLVMEEPEAIHASPTTIPQPATISAPSVKSKLSLDIPVYRASSAVLQPTPRHLHDLAERDHDESEVLKELGTNSRPTSRTHTPRSASTTTAVWLCSKPQASNPSSPIDENGQRRRSVGRPLVVRSMSTGRLASEFDEEGRVICLSNHCGRVLKGRPTLTSLPSPLEEGDELKRSLSVVDAIDPSRMGIARSQTAQNVAIPIPHRRRSVEVGFRRSESLPSWSKRAIGAGDMSM